MLAQISTSHGAESAGSSSEFKRERARFNLRSFVRRFVSCCCGWNMLFHWEDEDEDDRAFNWDLLLVTENDIIFDYAI